MPRVPFYHHPLSCKSWLFSTHSAYFSQRVSIMYLNHSHVAFCRCNRSSLCRGTRTISCRCACTIRTCTITTHTTVPFAKLSFRLFPMHGPCTCPTLCSFTWTTGCPWTPIHHCVFSCSRQGRSIICNGHTVYFRKTRGLSWQPFLSGVPRVGKEHLLQAPPSSFHDDPLWPRATSGLEKRQKKSYSKCISVNSTGNLSVD